ncbi:MAG: hypothetical protein MJ095_02405 [Oscillospiraceae bacterium]|nr:hypothetical protein [Oscillospiraceae bacterium]
MGMETSTSVVQQMAYRYNQLYLTPKRGISGTPEYADIVQYGKLSEEMTKRIENEGLSGFKGTECDRLFSEMTPAGKVDIVYLKERSDFERFLQIMAYNGEPADISPGIERAEIIGVTNWRRIEEHLYSYIETSRYNISLREELRRISENRKNFQDTIILVGGTGYSGLTAAEAGFGESQWEEISMKIRMYSSCAKFIMRRLFSDFRDIIWEEMLSDCIGILFALDRYDTALAKKILGVSRKGYDRRGKLINFCDESVYDIDELAFRVSETVELVGSSVKTLLSDGSSDYYDILFRLEENMSDFVMIYK